MATKFVDKLERLCHAATFDARDGLTLTFHDRATDNIVAAADQAVEQHFESARPSIFRSPR